MKVLDQHNFTIKGIDFSLKIEGDDLNPDSDFKVSVFHEFEGLHVCYVMRKMPADFLGGGFHCTYERHLIKPANGEVVNTRESTFYVTPKEFHTFFFSPTGSTPQGIVLARNLLNGICFDERSDKKKTDKISIPQMGFRPYGLTLQPQDIVSFDLAESDGSNADTKKVSFSITSWNQQNQVEEAPTGFSVDYKTNGEYSDPVQDVSEIDNLAYGFYTFRITLQSGAFMEKSINLVKPVLAE